MTDGMRDVDAWPRLTRFYGMAPSEIARTPHWLLKKYLAVIPELQAEEQLAALQASDYPHLLPADRRDVFRRLARLLGDEGQARPRPSDEELAAIGIAVVKEEVS